MESKAYVVVAVCTIGDPAGCLRAVAALTAQELPEHIRMSIVVVDNNPRPRVTDIVGAVPEDVRLVHEPSPGIAEARNAAVATATAMKADVLAFIDDDEIPADESWLARLVSALNTYGADITTGPVVSVFKPDTPFWMTRQPVFNRKRYKTGTKQNRAATNNVAFRTSLFKESNIWFDPLFSLTGGSDTELTRRLVESGAEIRWIDDAIVKEFVPAERSTLEWVLRRSRRIGANRIAFVRAAGVKRRAIAILIVGATVEGILALAIRVGSRPFSRRISLASRGRMARAFGTIAAVRGIEEYEYLRRNVPIEAPNSTPAGRPSVPRGGCRGDERSNGVHP